jgi:putative addiction module component (TIGR02574 family)
MISRQLMNDALRLPPTDRAALVGALMQSLEAERDPDAESPWLANARSRLETLREGQGTTISWSEAYRRIHQAVARRGTWD